MRIDELKRIAKENDYELIDDYVCGELILSRREEKYGDIINTITISKITEGYIAINNTFCDSVDLKMFKASIEFAETSIEDREEEKYYLVKFSKKEIEEIKKKFDTDLKYFELVEVKE